jgi:hypothetical protein
VYYDNVCAVYVSTNPVQHQHIEIDMYFVHERVGWEHLEGGGE